MEALKAKHPTLATISDIADIAEDKDVIGKLKALDAKEAVKTDSTEYRYAVSHWNPQYPLNSAQVATWVIMNIM